MRFLTCFCSLLLALSACGKELTFNFGNYTQGSLPPDFHAVLEGGGPPAKWQIVAEDVPPIPSLLTSTDAPPVNRGVLAQTSQDMTDERFPMFVYDGDEYRDFQFSARFKIASGITEQLAGLVFRFQNASNFYVARVSSMGHNVRFYKVVNGLRSDPIGPDMEVPAGTWHTLGVQCEGNQISLRLDGKLVMPALTDNTFREGKIGFRTKSDSVVYYADARVEFTPRIPMAEQMVDSVMSKQTKLLGLRIYAMQTNSDLPVIIASNDKSEIGHPGTEAELMAITDSQTYYGTETGVVLVTLPLRDRNGDAIGAVRVKMESYFTESRYAEIVRAGRIRKKLEELCTTAEELRK
jgi:hypothetical protein